MKLRTAKNLKPGDWIDQSPLASLRVVEVEPSPVFEGEVLVRCDYGNEPLERAYGHVGLFFPEDERVPLRAAVH